MTNQIHAKVDFGADRVREAYGNRRPFSIQALSVITDAKHADARKVIDPEVKTFGRGYFVEPEAFDDGVFSRAGYAHEASGILYKSTINGVRAKNIGYMSSELLMLDCNSASLSKKLREANWNNALQFVLRAHMFYMCVHKTNGTVKAIVPRFDDETAAFIGFSNLCDPHGRIIFNQSVYSALPEYDITQWYCFLTSPSGQRKNTALCLRAPSDKMSEVTPIMEDMVDELTYGAWSVMKAAYKGKKLSFNKMCKLLSRPTLPMTGSTAYGEIKTLAVHVGDFENAEGIKFFDGQGTLSVNVFTRAYKAKYGIDIDPKELIGICPQGRFACFKGLHPTCSPKAMRVRIKACAKGLENIIFYSKEDTTFELSVKLQKGGSDVDGKIHVFGLPVSATVTGDKLSSDELNSLLESVDFFGDSCVNKTMPDFSRIF